MKACGFVKVLRLSLAPRDPKLVVKLFAVLCLLFDSSKIRFDHACAVHVPAIKLRCSEFGFRCGWAIFFQGIVKTQRREIISTSLQKSPRCPQAVPDDAVRMKWDTQLGQ